MTEPTMETLARRPDRVERENRWFKKAGLAFLGMIGAVVLGILAMGAFDSAFGAEPTWGIWTDREGEVTYAFLENHLFWFHDKRAKKPVRIEGLWETAPRMCYLGINEGNLMIYVDTDQCCLEAHYLGAKLVVSKIWEKGFYPVKLCSNRVLIKAK